MCRSRLHLDRAGEPRAGLSRKTGTTSQIAFSFEGLGESVAADHQATSVRWTVCRISAAVQVAHRAENETPRAGLPLQNGAYQEKREVRSVGRVQLVFS